MQTDLADASILGTVASYTYSATNLPALVAGGAATSGVGEAIDVALTLTQATPTATDIVFTISIDLVTKR